MPATWPPPTIGLCIHCGASIVRSGKLDTGADAWMDKTTSPVCVPPALMHWPIPAGHGLRGEAR